MTDQEKIQQLQAENKQLKETLKEGRYTYTKVDDILGISKAVNSGFLMFKMPKIIQGIQQNPDMISKIAEYSAKLKTMDLD